MTIFGRKGGGFGYGLSYEPVNYRTLQIFLGILADFTASPTTKIKTPVAKNLRKNESLERTTIYVWVGVDQLWTTNRL